MAEEEFAPRSTGKDPETISLDGCLIPYYADEQPVLLNMPMSEDFYLPCFASEDELRSVMGRVGVSFDRIKQIEDGPDFLASIPASVVVITKIRFTDEGRVRFNQVFRD